MSKTTFTPEQNTKPEALKEDTPDTSQNKSRLYHEHEMRRCWRAAMKYAIQEYEYGEGAVVKITFQNEDEYIKSLK